MNKRLDQIDKQHY